MKEIQIDRNTLNVIHNTLCGRDNESGGIIGTKNGIISEFYYDEHAITSYGFYHPDISMCEKIINEIWKPSGIIFCGFIHTHHRNTIPSDADIEYFHSIFDGISCETIRRNLVLSIIDRSSNEPILSFYRGMYVENCIFSISPINFNVISTQSKHST